jgi:mutator protein MutT
MKTYAVGVIQNDNGEILLLRRSFTAPWMPNKWCLPGGNVEKDETTEEALLRELSEEIGLEANEQNLSLLRVVKETGDSNIHETYFYFVDENLNLEDVIVDFEHDRCEFVNPLDFQNYDFIPNLENVLENILFEKIDEVEKAFDTLLSNDKNPFEKGIRTSIGSALGKIGSKIASAGASVSAGAGHHGAQVGETRTWSGKQFQKQSDGSWKEYNTNSKESKQEDTGQQKNQKTEDNSSDKSTHEQHSDSQFTPEKMKEHASKTSSDKLKSYINKFSNDKTKKQLVESAKQELKGRGIDVSEGENVYDKHGDGENTKESKTTSEKQSESKVDKTEEKKQQTPEASQSKQEKPSEEEDKGETIKTEEGEYNPGTGNGWNGDNSLGMKDEDKKKLRMESESLSASTKVLLDPEGAKHLMVISGRAGTGKSYNTKKAVKDLGYSMINTSDKDFDASDHPNGAYVELKGTKSNYGDFLGKLYKYTQGSEDMPEGKFVFLNFDDSDNMLENDDVVNMLKTFEGENKKIQIPQTYKKRMAESIGVDPKTIPDSFNIDKLKIGFITNKNLEGNEDMNAVLSRSEKHHISPSDKELLYSMSTQLRNTEIDGKKIPFKEAKEYYDFTKQNLKNIPEGKLSGRFYGDLKNDKLKWKHSEEFQKEYPTWQDYAKSKMPSSKIKKAFENLLSTNY